MRYCTPTVCAAVLLAALGTSCSVEGRRPGDGGTAAETPAPLPGRATAPEGTLAGAAPMVREKTSDGEGAMRFRRLSWLDEHGNLDAGAHQRALDQRRANIDSWASPGARNVAGISFPSWTDRGPSNIGGRTLAPVLVHPTQTNRLWAGTETGGIWSSSNGGTTWSKTNDFLPSLLFSSMAMDPRSPDTMYAGIGDYRGVGIYGVYRTVNAGVTWSLMPNTNWGRIWSIALHPTSPGIMLVGAGPGGIRRSTDAGLTWSNPAAVQACLCVAFDPTDGNKAVAALRHYDAHTGQPYYRAAYSTNAGATWVIATGPLARVDGPESRIELAYSKNSPNIVYAACGGDGKIYKSTDGGHSYAAVTTSGSTFTSGFCAPLWVDPTNPNVLMAGGGPGVVRSVDGGVTLTQISCGYINTVDAHPDVHAVVSDPGYNGTTNRWVYVSTDGGIYKAEDAYTVGCYNGWTRLDQTYRSTQFYSAAGHGPSGYLYGGTQDNGSLLLKPGSDAASVPFGGDGGFSAIDYTNPNTMYGEFLFLQIHRSRNGGASAGYITTGLADAGSEATANWIAPFVLDPNVHTRMLAGGVSLWRSNNVDTGYLNGQPTWAVIRPPGSSYINAIAIAPGNSDIVWTSQNDAKIYKSTNATAATPTWAAIDDNSTVNPLPDRWVGRIVIDPDDPNTVYVGLGGFATDNLWKTIDGGVTWVRISGTVPAALPAAPVRGIARHPSRPDWLYVGTEVGIFASGDGGSTWSTSDDGPANVCTDELVFMYNSNTLLAATYGRGLFTAPVTACPADFNGDGFVDGIDYDRFNSAFESGGRTADFNRDGFVDGIDYDQFNNAFDAGC